MDGKGSRRLSSKNDRPRTRNVVEIGKKYAKFLVIHRQSLLAGILLTGMVVLLFGVFSRFQVPSFSTSPSGATVLDFSAFKEQVRAGNVQAVSIQNNEVNGLLVNPLQKSQTGTTSQKTTSASQRATDFTAWSHYLGKSTNDK